MADQVVKAVPAKDFILDTTGRKTVELEKALHFEPYHGMHTRRIDRLFDEDLANLEVKDSFLHDLLLMSTPSLWSKSPHKQHYERSVFLSILQLL